MSDQDELFRGLRAAMGAADEETVRRFDELTGYPRELVLGYLQEDAKAGDLLALDPTTGRIRRALTQSAGQADQT